MENLRILGLVASNIGPMKANTIRFDGKSGIIVGPANIGKTTNLEAMGLLICGGKKNVKQSHLLKSGEKNGAFDAIVVDGEGKEYHLTLSVTEKGLTVSGKKPDKGKMSRTEITDLLGNLSPNLYDFLRLKPKEQVDYTLKAAGGKAKEKYEQAQAKHRGAYDGRRDANRDIKRITGAIEEIPQDATKWIGKDDPSTELPDLISSRDEALRLADVSTTAEEEAARLEDAIKKLQEDLKLVKAHIGKAAEYTRQANAFQGRIDNIQGDKDLWVHGQALERLRSDLEKAEAESEAANKEIERSARMKGLILKGMGLDGYSIDEEEGIITPDGRPLYLEGESQRIRHALKLLVDLHSKSGSKVDVIWADGLESLGIEGLKEAVKYCEENGLQFIGTWIDDAGVMDLVIENDTEGILTGIIKKMGR